MSTGFALRNKVQSLDRALEILRLLGSEPEMRVTDLARRLEVHKSTVFRLLSTLQEHGLVDQNPTTERYRLGYGLVRLAGAVVAELDLARASRSVLEQLAFRTGETVNLRFFRATRWSTSIRSPRRTWSSTSTGWGSRPRCTPLRAAKCCSRTSQRRSGAAC